MIIQVNGDEYSKNNKDFYNFLILWKIIILKQHIQIVKNGLIKNYHYEAIDDMYRRIIKPVKNDENPFKVKGPIDNGKVQCSIYNHFIYMDISDLRKFLLII